MRQRPLLRSALMLMGAGAVSRIIGTVYRIIIVRWAGAEALGLFQMIMPLHRLASAMSTLRLPVALTRTTADALARGDLGAVHRARRLTAVLIIALSVLTGIAVIALAPFFATRFLTDGRTERLILLLPLAFVPSALTGIFRGFAEGKQYMTSTAVGQIAEQLVRVPFVLILLSQWAARGVEYLAAALTIGLGVGEIAGLIVAMILSGWWALPPPPKKRRRRPFVSVVLEQAQTARGLLGVSIPVWLTTVINSVVQMINVSLIPRRLLTAGFTMVEATALYGQLTGMVMPLLYMPMLLVFPVATVLTPAIADAVAAGRHRTARRQFVRAVGGATIVGMLTTAAMMIWPEALPRLLYGLPEIGPLVQLTGLAAPFAMTAAIFASVLYALGKTNVLLVNFVVTAGLRLVLIYYLTADPRYGIVGALWAVIADYVLTAILNGVACIVYLRRDPL